MDLARPVSSAINRYAVCRTSLPALEVKHHFHHHRHRIYPGQGLSGCEAGTHPEWNTIAGHRTHTHTHTFRHSENLA